MVLCSRQCSAGRDRPARRNQAAPEAHPGMLSTRSSPQPGYRERASNLSLGVRRDPRSRSKNCSASSRSAPRQNSLRVAPRQECLVAVHPRRAAARLHSRLKTWTRKSIHVSTSLKLRKSQRKSKLNFQNLPSEQMKAARSRESSYVYGN